MKEDSLKEEIVKVPQDMLIDVLAILLQEELPFEIIQVQQSRNTGIIAIRHDSKLSRPVKVLQNIKDILDQYEQYRHSEQENYNWRES